MQTMPTLRIVGIVLLLWAYGMNVHSVIGAWQDLHQSPEAAAAEHRKMMQQQSSSAHPEMDMSAASGQTRPVLTTTGVLLTGGMLVAGVLLALFPVRLGAWYGVWATVVVWIAIAGPRIMNDRRCWQVLDPNKHGCHTFMASLAIAVAGMVCCALAQKTEKR